jgi:hypothetical protein
MEATTQQRGGIVGPRVATVYLRRKPLSRARVRLFLTKPVILVKLVVVAVIKLLFYTFCAPNLPMLFGASPPNVHE